MHSQDPSAFNGCSLRMRFCGMDASSPFLPSRQHEGTEALESCASECLTTYNLPCTKPQLHPSCAAQQQQQHGRFPHAKMAKTRRPCHQDAAFVIPSKSAALALPHEHRNLRPFDDACAWIRQEGYTARRRAVLHGIMASLTSIQVACAPEIAALLETIPFCECKKDKRLSLTSASPDRHLQECLLFGTQSHDPVAFINCSLRMRFCGMDAASLFIPSRQHEGIEVLESYASECLTTYNLPCTKPQLQRSCAAAAAARALSSCEDGKETPAVPSGRCFRDPKQKRCPRPPS